jgi:hypothetical protein
MRRSHIFLVMILALHFAMGAGWEYRFWNYYPDGYPPRLLDWFLTPYVYWSIVAISLYFWSRTDAKLRGISLPAVATFIVPLLFPIGVPYYFLRTYQVRPAVVRIGLSAAFVGACIATQIASGGLVWNYYAVWTNYRIPH